DGVRGTSRLRPHALDAAVGRHAGQTDRLLSQAPRRGADAAEPESRLRQGRHRAVGLRGGDRRPRQGRHRARHRQAHRPLHERRHRRLPRQRVGEEPRRHAQLRRPQRHHAAPWLARDGGEEAEGLRAEDRHDVAAGPLSAVLRPREDDEEPAALRREGHARVPSVKFGIFYEQQLPRPWGERSEYELYQHSLAQIELADRLGYDHAWVVEHHFLEEYSHCSAPEVFLGAATQRTQRIRLGHGIVQLPTNHPIRVAERVATLDLLSAGRVELGLGEGQGPVELHPFGVRVRDKREVWEEAVRALIPMFTRQSVEWHGTHFDFPERNVIPKPLQKPHPPLWVACSNIATIANAGRWGMGALGFQFVSAEAARAWVTEYYLNFTQRRVRLADYAPNP